MAISPICSSAAAHRFSRAFAKAVALWFTPISTGARPPRQVAGTLLRKERPYVADLGVRMM